MKRKRKIQDTLLIITQESGKGVSSDTHSEIVLHVEEALLRRENVARKSTITSVIGPDINKSEAALAQINFRERDNLRWDVYYITDEGEGLLLDPRDRKLLKEVLPNYKYTYQAVKHVIDTLEEEDGS